MLFTKEKYIDKE